MVEKKIEDIYIPIKNLGRGSYGEANLVYSEDEKVFCF